MFTKRLFILPTSFELSSALLTTVKILAFAHLISENVYAIHPTQGPSMLPTLSVIGDSVLISKRYRRGRGVKVGDVVEIRHPVPEYPRHGAVKRVIGLGGDFVVRTSPPGWPTRIMEEGQERMIQVRLLPGSIFHDHYNSKNNNRRGVQQIPQGHCWIEGDNLPDSRDSREYGPVPLALVKGKVIAKVWPLGEVKWIPNGLVAASQDNNVEVD